MLPWLPSRLSLISIAHVTSGVDEFRQNIKLCPALSRVKLPGWKPTARIIHEARESLKIWTYRSPPVIDHLELMAMFFFLLRLIEGNFAQIQCSNLGFSSTMRKKTHTFAQCDVLSERLKISDLVRECFVNFPLGAYTPMFHQRWRVYCCFLLDLFVMGCGTKD